MTWETHRTLALIVAAVAIIAATVGGLAGYQLGSTPPVVPQIIFQPGAIQIMPAPG